MAVRIASLTPEIVALFVDLAVSTDDVFEVLTEELEAAHPFFFSRGGVLVPTLAQWMTEAR